MKPLSKKEIAQAFRDFLNHDVPKFMDMYDNDHGYIIAEVFRIKTESGVVLDLSGDKNLEVEYFFPIARVWQVGLAYNDEAHQLLNWSGLEGVVDTTYTSPGVLPAHRYQPGQLLRLKDDDVRTVINPDWQAVERAKAQYDQGGTEMTAKPSHGQQQKHLSNLRKRLGKRQFVPNPFEMDSEKWGRFAFCLESPHIMCGIDEKWARHLLLGEDLPQDAVEDPKMVMIGEDGKPK